MGPGSVVATVRPHATKKSIGNGPCRRNTLSQQLEPVGIEMIGVPAPVLPAVRSVGVHEKGRELHSSRERLHQGAVAALWDRASSTLAIERSGKGLLDR